MQAESEEPISIQDQTYDLWLECHAEHKITEPKNLTQNKKLKEEWGEQCLSGICVYVSWTSILLSVQEVYLS